MTKPFLSVCVPLHNEEQHLSVVSEISQCIHEAGYPHELIVIDNGSSDGTLAGLKSLCLEVGNLQVYSLLFKIPFSDLVKMGTDVAIGETVCMFDPTKHSLADFSAVLQRYALAPIDVVSIQADQGSCHWSQRVFYWLFRRVHALGIGEDSKYLKLVNRRVVQFLSQGSMPVIRWRLLSRYSRFSQVELPVSKVKPAIPSVAEIRESIPDAFSLLLFSSKAPLRIAATTCLLGGLSSLSYFGYTLGIAMFKSTVAPGWVSLSLLISLTMFFVSLVLFIMGEYLGFLVNDSKQRLAYCIQEEMTSKINLKNKLNLEETDA